MRPVMFYFMTEAKPCADNPECEECTGAYVNCFIQAETVTSAMQTMQALLASEGWEQVQILECAEADDRESYAEDEELLECYDEAEECGSSAVFYTWDQDEEE